MKEITKSKYLYLKAKKHGSLLNSKILISDEEYDYLMSDEQDIEIPDEPQEIHTITFKDGDEIIKTVTGEMGTYVSCPYVEKEGYEFLGWSLDGEKITMPIDGIYDADITYIAVWEKIENPEEPIEEDDHDYSQDYFTIEALDDNMQISLGSENVQYSLDNGETWEMIEEYYSPAINTGQKILFKQYGLINPRFRVNGIRYYNDGTTVTGRFNASGNIMSLIYGDNFLNYENINNISLSQTFDGMFGSNSYDLHIINAKNLILPLLKLSNNIYISMFAGCTSLITAPKLPATTLTVNCYKGMFAGCTSLTTAPELPATTLAANCYENMFAGCTSLITAPKLPATMLEVECYRNMFINCTSLLTPPQICALILKEDCCVEMFSGCTSLTTAPELPATTLANGCYDNMFHGCTVLTTAPELPATMLALSCYSNMFHGCTGLTTAPELPATTLTSNCYSAMFQGCTGLTSVPELPATTLANSCYYLMFSGCKGLTTAPELPATTLANSCYEHMFDGCTSLTTAPSILPATTLPGNCYKNMFKGCTSLTTAPELPATTLANNCYAYMFNECTSLNYIKCLAYNNINNELTSWLPEFKYVNEEPKVFVKYYGDQYNEILNYIPNNWTIREIDHETEEVVNEYVKL